MMEAGNTVSGFVSVPASFFQKELREYSNWRSAFIREALQNCVDAPGSSVVKFEVETKQGDTVITFENNGAPMDRDTIVDKLLALGQSGKNCEGTVGGFGKAKIILYFAHGAYGIKSGNLVLDGSGSGYKLEEREEYLAGTRSVVVISGTEYVEEFKAAAVRLASRMQWGGEFYLNGERLATNLRKGSPRREFKFGVVYTNRSFSNLVLVRMNGIPMFSQYTSFEGCVLVELKGSSFDTLTSNRDGFKGEAREEFTRFIDELTSDKKSALRQERHPSHMRFQGWSFGHNKPGVPVREGVSSGEGIRHLVVSPALFNELHKELKGRGGVSGGGGGTWSPGVGSGEVVERGAEVEGVTVELQRVMNRLGSEFIIKNNVGMSIPEHYLPSSERFGNYALKLATFWGRIMLQMHRLFEGKLPSGFTRFCVGFVFSEEAEAEHERAGDCSVYYINPVTIVKQESSSSRSMKNRFSLTDRNEWIALALHEFIHGACRISRHDEDFSSTMTSMMPVVLNHRSDFNWCFK